MIIFRWKRVDTLSSIFRIVNMWGMLCPFNERINSGKLPERLR